MATPDSKPRRRNPGASRSAPYLVAAMAVPPSVGRAGRLSDPTTRLDLPGRRRRGLRSPDQGCAGRGRRSPPAWTRASRAAGRARRITRHADLSQRGPPEISNTSPMLKVSSDEKRGPALQTCITCGAALHPERALKYSYCMSPECQEKNAKGLTMVAVGVNKSAEQYLILDEKTKADLAGGKYHDQRRGTFGTSPAAAP